MAPLAELKDHGHATSPRSTSSEPAQRVEVVLFVVVQRCLFAQPPETSDGIGVEPHVVRMQNDIARLLSRYSIASRRNPHSPESRIAPL